MPGDNSHELVERLQRTNRRWRAVFLVALLILGTISGATGVLIEKTRRSEQRIENTLDRLETDFARLERSVERLRQEAPALREAAERAPDENRIVPIFWEEAPDGSQRRGALFPDDQMYRDFDVPARGR
jgi:hypothetical protein